MSKLLSAGNSKVPYLYIILLIGVKLAPRNQEFCENEFPFVKTSLFDSEFNSESNGDIFIHGQTIGKKFSLISICLLYMYMRHYTIVGTQYLCTE